MSEIFGGQNNEFEDSSEFNLDEEWAELNKSLDVSAEAQMKHMQQKAEFKTFQDEVMQLLYDQNIPHVVDTDVDRELELFRDYIHTYHELRLEEMGEADEYSLRQIAIQCMYDYFEQREYETLVLNNGTVLRYMALNQASSPGTQVYVRILKKQLQAELLIHYARPMDERWQRFLDEIVPGDRFDISRPEDRFYRENAEDSLPGFAQEKARKNYVIDEAKEIIGLNVDEGDLEDVITAIAGLLNMHSIAAVPIHTESQRANRNAELWTEVRFISQDDSVVRRVVDLFDSTYPIDNPYT